MALSLEEKVDVCAFCNAYTNSMSLILLGMLMLFHVPCLASVLNITSVSVYNRSSSILARSFRRELLNILGRCQHTLKYKTAEKRTMEFCVMK